MFLFLVSDFQQFGYDMIRCDFLCFYSAWSLQRFLGVWVTQSKFGNFSTNISSCFVCPIFSLWSFWISHYTYAVLLVTPNQSFSICSLFISILFSLSTSACMILITLSSNSLILYSVVFNLLFLLSKISDFRCCDFHF